MCVRVPEIDRRQNHISQVNPNHSLLPIALDCLKDKESERPSAHQLCERVADLKGMPQYRDSARTIQDKDEVIRSQAVQLQEKETQLGLLNEQLRQLQIENARQKDENERQLGRIRQQLEASEQLVDQFERRIAELEQQLSEREQQKTKASSRGKELTSFKLRWREGKMAPCKMYRWCDAVVDGNAVYIKDSGSKQTYCYDITSHSWSQLPDCVYQESSITIISGWLTTVGGYQSSYVNELFSLTGEGSGRRWTKKFPPMPTKRSMTTSLCTGTTLIVAGGLGERARVLSMVEVMDTETHQWSTAADLPQPMYLASATVCEDQFYMLGGFNKNFTCIKSVYACSVSSLLQSCVPSSLEANFERQTLSDKASVWRQVADLPVTQSTCESFHSQLLAIGGRMDSGRPTTAVYMYDSTTNSWEIITHMTTARRYCSTAVLPNNQLMVVGGFITDSGETSTDTVEIASICN